MKILIYAILISIYILSNFEDNPFIGCWEPTVLSCWVWNCRNFALHCRQMQCRHSLTLIRQYPLIVNPELNCKFSSGEEVNIWGLNQSLDSVTSSGLNFDCTVGIFGHKGAQALPKTTFILRPTATAASAAKQWWWQKCSSSGKAVTVVLAVAAATVVAAVAACLIHLSHLSCLIWYVATCVKLGKVL